MMIKDPGPGGMRLRQVPLDMSFAETLRRRARPTPTSGCCMDVIRGNQTLFMRRDEVEAAWTWVDPILDAWDDAGQDAAGLHRRHLGPVRVDRADRARRPHLARERLTDGVVLRTAQLRQPRRAWRRRWPATVAGKLSRARSPARGVGLLAVSGGSTPALLFADLSKAAIDWAKVIVTLVDERLVPPDQPRSNAGLVADKLLQGPAAAATFVPLYHGADDGAEAAQAGARRRSARCRGRSTWRSSAWAPDGHTASFFPGRAER